MSTFLNILLFLAPISLPAYLLRFKIFNLPTTVLEIFIFILIFAWILKNKEKILRINPHQILGIWFWPILIWFLATILAIIISPNPILAFGYWRAFILEPLVFFYILQFEYQNHNSKIFSYLFYGIIVSLAITSIYSLIQFLTNINLPAPWNTAWNTRRSTGFFGYPNGLSLFLTPFIITVLAYFLEFKKQIKKQHQYLFLIIIIISSLALLSSKSIGAFLALLISSIILFINHRFTKKIGIIIALVSVLFSFFAGYKIFHTELHPQTIEQRFTSEKKWSSLVRLIIWQESWQIVKHHPLLGTGLRSYKTSVKPYHQKKWLEIFPHPHNLFLMIWIEIGLLGLLSFILICLVWIKQKNNLNLHQTIQISSPLIAILIHGLVDLPYFKNDLAIQFWLLAFISQFLIQKYASKK
jgi:O-antigen ligase